jgi:hypothetical protein
MPKAFKDPRYVFYLPVVSGLLGPFIITVMPPGFSVDHQIDVKIESVVMAFDNWYLLHDPFQEP